MKERRNWTADQKLSIIKEAGRDGVTETIRRHGLFSNTYYQWKDKYDIGGIEALGSRHYKPDPELKRLTEENRRLKELLADKELALAIKEELLKKSLQREKKRL